MNVAPEKIRLIPDQWHIHHVGQLHNGRLFLVDTQLDARTQPTRDFVCTFIFDADGNLVNHEIELIGSRGTYAVEAEGKAIDRHIKALGKFETKDVWLRPFQVNKHGADFGFIARSPDEFGDPNDEACEWRVEFMPGNTLSFYAPWEAGEYDT